MDALRDVHARPAVLVVDDEPMVLRLMQAVLGEAYDIHIAESGEEALATAERAVIQAALIDIRMRGLDGLALAERLRALPGLAELPIVIVTAEIDPGLRRRAEHLGIQGYLVKPFDVEELEDALRILFPSR